MICLNQKLHRNFQLSAKFKLVQRPDVCSLSHLTQKKRDFQKYCFGHIQNENIGNPTSYSWDVLSSFLYSLPCDKAHHFKWWYHWIMMTQKYHPACAPSFASGILLTTQSSLFLGLCVPSLKYQIRHLSSRPSLFFSLNLWQWALARNQMRFLYFCQSNLETLLRVLSNALKCIHKLRRIFKWPNSVLQWKIWACSNILRYVENTLITILTSEKNFYCPIWIAQSQVIETPSCLHNGHKEQIISFHSAKSFYLSLSY